MIIIRNGYGSNFNTLEINDNFIIKKNKNEYGYLKILNEIIFYKYIINNNIDFNIPKIYNLEENKNKKCCIKMEYLKEYIELYKIFEKLENKDIILENIFKNLENLHLNNIIVSKEQYYSDLILETITKIKTRIYFIENIVNKYNYIKKVNNIKLKSYDEILLIINNNIHKYYESLKIYEYSIIHGDCQFNNILINKSNNDIKFIDPRGYFGNTKIFGIKEYDTAKIYFALSGYDSFDNSIIDNLIINDDNIEINLNIIDKNILNKNIFITSLVISIWLGNAHIFIDNENKCITSYFIALYLASIYLI